MINGLQEFLKEHEKSFPNDVVHVDKEVSAKWELSAICAKAEKANKFPPVFIFHNVRSLDGRSSDMPVVCNMFASRDRCSRALNSSLESFGTDLYRLKQQVRAPVIVPPAEAPVKQVVKRNGEIDLLSLPVPVYHDWDAGSYVTAGFLTCFDPSTGKDNCALQRGFISDKREIRFWTTEQSHNRWILKEYEEKGEDAPIAYWVGHHPAVYFGTQGKFGFHKSHYEVAGGVSGAPLRLTSSETLGKDFLVPADAELVIEGHVKFGVRKPEGPFGECRGYTGGQRMSPVIEVSAVTQRKDAMWLGLMCGHKDYAGLATYYEGVVYERVNQFVPVHRVYIPPAGLGMIIYISIRQNVRGQATEAIASSLTGTGIKHVFVFDEDINIFDEDEVMFGLATRVQWDEDVHIFSNFRGDNTDPAIKADGSTSKGGIDCTLPIDKTSFERRNTIPKNVMDSVDLSGLVKVRS